MRRIYVAGPYSIGDVNANVRRAIDAGEELFNHGFYPFVPHLNHWWHELYPHDWGEWLKLNREWLYLCDGMVRLHGESRGADREEEWAQEANIPIFGSVAECMAAAYR